MINNNENPRMDIPHPLHEIDLALATSRFLRPCAVPYAVAIPSPPNANVKRGKRNRGKCVFRIKSRIHNNKEIISLITGYLVTVTLLPILAYLHGNLPAVLVVETGGLATVWMCFKKVDGGN
jgi:hypothetical protein